MSENETENTATIHPCYGADVRVPLTLRIGVTGHRPHKLPSINQSELGALYAQISAALNTIHRAALSICAREDANWLYRNDRGPCMRITTALAEGADRMVVDREALDLNFEFEQQAILPFLREQYEADFLPGASLTDPQAGTVDEFHRLLAQCRAGDSSPRVLELDGSRADEEGAYARCGEFIVNHSDLLLAVWDPEEKNPGKGGTADVVRMALMQGIPVVRVGAKAPHSIGILAATDFSASDELPPDQPFGVEEVVTILGGKLLFLDLLEPGPSLAGAQAKEDCRAEIRARMADYEDEHGVEASAAPPPNYLDDGPIDLKRSAPLSFEGLFVAIRNLLAPKTAVDRVIEEWRLEIKPEDGNSDKDGLPPGADADSALNQIYATYLRSDRLSNFYASLHRSIFITIYLMGAFALIAAAAALRFYHAEIEGLGLSVRYVFVTIELALLLSIYFLWRADRNSRYHDRWIEYRALAEFMRPLTHLSFFGATFPLTRYRDAEEAWARECLGHGGPVRSWILIYAETVSRYAGLPSVRMDSEGLALARKLAAEKWVGPQVNYHIRNAARMHLMGHKLHALSKVFFGLTIAMVLFKLLLGDYAQQIGAGLWVAVLPALASAFFAIRNHAEFDISAQRSQEMRVHLDRLLNRLNGPYRDSSELIDTLHETAETTMRESADWVHIFEVKKSETA